MSPHDLVRLRASIGRAFSPSHPVDTFTLFAGRLKQVKALVDAITSRGRHAILYGDRGVGKTSLATILKDIYQSGIPHLERVRVVKINCVASDDFRNVGERCSERSPLFSKAHASPLRQHP